MSRGSMMLNTCGWVSSREGENIYLMLYMKLPA